MKYLLNTLSLSILGAGLSALPASADVIASYDFSGNTASSSDSEINSIAGSMTTIGPGATDGIGANSIYYQVKQSADTDTLSLGSGYNAFEFTITAEAGFELNLASLSFDFGGTNNQVTDVTYNYTMQTSVDGFGSTSSVVGSGSVTLGQVGSSITYGPTQTITLSDSSFQGLDTITIRVNPWTPLDTTDTIRVDNVILNGTVSAIPEVNSFALLLAGCAGALVATRRRRSL